MVFVSDTFLFLFLPIFLVVYFLLPNEARNTWILIASWVFYAWWRPEFLALLIFICIWSWGTGLWIARNRSGDARLPLLIAVLGPLLSLIYFKYMNLIFDTAIYWGVPVQTGTTIILPIGLSFFVFGAISYSVDVYRGTTKAEPNPIDYATYQSMFGHLVAGPIVRYKSISERLKHRVFRPQEFELGVQRFMQGFAMKILVADTLAPLADAGFAISEPSVIDSWIATLAYTLQIYFDFAGYSHMAIGLGLMVGLRFPENFNQPYLSGSVVEFWHRWHISLSTWLRDYLYIPLGGNREGGGRTIVNIIITMGLGGLWHGASWTFLAWGLWHAFGLITVRFWSAFFDTRLPYWFAQPVTFIFVMLGWVLFRANDWAGVGTMLSGLTGANGFPLSPALAVEIRPVQVLTMILGVVIIYLPAILQWPRQNAWVKIRAAGIFVVWIAAVIILQGRTTVPFLYYQF